MEILYRHMNFNDFVQRFFLPIMKSLKDLALDIDSSNSTDASGNALVSALEENYYLEGVDVIHNIDEKQELSNKN
jgi:hypothetical protein